MRALTALVLVVLAACATAPARHRPADPVSCEPPFTAAQIRAATRVGRTYDFEVESAGQPPTGLRLRFVEVTSEHARLERSVVDAEGQAIAPTQSSTVSWDELVRHAAWPRDATTIEEAQVTVPAGTFPDAVLYTVRETEAGKEKVTRAWFARSLPGAPVVHVVVVDGVEVMKMRLVRYQSGT